jgi:renalase
MVKVAVVGAGLAGLVCAQHLQRVGCQVVVLEKSRGLGGRLATRRLAHTWADHGVRALHSQGELTRQLLQILGDRNLLHPWAAPVYQVQANGSYTLPERAAWVSPVGLTAAAKALATGLDIRRGQRVVAIAPRNSAEGAGWQLTCETIEPAPPTHLQAEVLVLMIPAPQAQALLSPLATHGALNSLLEKLQAVEFDPCITAIAAYAERPPQSVRLPWADAAAIALSNHPQLTWVSLEASKLESAGAIAVVVQSSAAFAQAHFEAGAQSVVGHILLESASQVFPYPLTHPTLLQVHRWRYAFCRRPAAAPYLSAAEPGLLFCGGDWCTGRSVEDALTSGLRTAAALCHQLGLSSEAAGRESGAIAAIL